MSHLARANHMTAFSCKGDVGNRVFGKGEWDRHGSLRTILIHALGLGSS